MLSSKALAVLVMALIPALPVAATATFQNEGTMTKEGDGIDQWSHYNHENSGTVTEDATEGYDSPPSLHMIQTYDPDYTGRYHSEAIRHAAYVGIGQSGFYGFAFKLAKDWDFSGSQSYNIGQFIADFGDASGNNCGEDWLPSIMVWLVGDQLQTRLKTGSVCTTKFRQIPNIATVTEGEWHKIVMEVSWQADTSGYYRLWYDGEQVVDEENVATTYKDDAGDRSFQFSVGLYANAWHDQGTLKGNGTREVWIDKVAIGSTTEDADPDLWGSDVQDEDDESCDA